MRTTSWRDCQHEVSTQAMACPHCGAYYPYKEAWDGWGFEWKSKAELMGLPLVHVTLKYRPNSRPVVAKGWLAIGQFSYGFFNVSQFGMGPFALSQFAPAGGAICQMGVAGAAIAQMCLAFYGISQTGVVYGGFGQVVLRLKDLL